MNKSQRFLNSSAQVFRTGVISLATCLIILGLLSPEAEGKRKRRFTSPPLKIIDVTASPVPYTLGTGLLELQIEVELPNNLKEADVLEVSSLITSPSKRSMRFLSNRQPIDIQPDSSGKSHVATTLFWDGMDQTNTFVSEGPYHYEVRAKLITVWKDGYRTTMVSLRKRGVLDVKANEEESEQGEETSASSAESIGLDPDENLQSERVI